MHFINNNENLIFEDNNKFDKEEMVHHLGHYGFLKR